MIQKYITLAGIELLLMLEFQETFEYVSMFANNEFSLNASDYNRVIITPEQFDVWKAAGNPIDAFAEFCLACMPTSEALFAYNRCIFHAAAVRVYDRAWLITAGSGVGKSTQCRNLMELSPDLISIINGDKPVLECRADGEVIAHPSPWNGKEGWHGAAAAPLAGIVLLQRGAENSIRAARPVEAACRIFQGIFQSYVDIAMIRDAGRIADMIMKSVPVWVLTSEDTLDPVKQKESTKLLLDVMLQEGNL